MSPRLAFQRSGRGAWGRALAPAVVIALLGMLLPAAAGPAFGDASVVSAGSVPIGGLYAGTATFTFTENSMGAFPASDGTLVVGITDSAGNSTVHFGGNPTVTAPLSLGASVSVDW